VSEELREIAVVRADGVLGCVSIQLDEAEKRFEMVGYRLRLALGHLPLHYGGHGGHTSLTLCLPRVQIAKRAL